MKKVLALILAIAMTIATTVTAFAAETFTITINNNKEGHIYEAYQIFAGNLSADGKLSNIVWGSGIVDGETAFGKAEEKAAALTEDNAAAFAEEAATHLGNAAGTSTFADGKYTIAGLQPGYYLIKDKDNTLTLDDDSYTNYILKVVSNVEATPKSDTPKVEKKVKDIDDSTETELGAWQDSADHDIGDDVPFQLTGTLPNNYDTYDTYTYIFHDTLSAGLTYNNDAKVYVVNGSEKTDVTESFSINATGTELTVSTTNLKAITDPAITSTSKIVVEYTAELNTNAVLGSAGNPNKVYLEYSNNPNQNGEGGNDETGKTPEDKVIVFTYKTVVNKVDGTGAPLTGAEFTLEKEIAGKDGQEATWTQIAVVKNEAGTEFTFKGLDDGKYRLTETVTPDGYNTIKPVEFRVTGTHEVDSEDPKLTALNGEAITGTIDLTANLAEGSLTTSIENKAGSVLPSTGGIGTTIFYVVGGILVVGAAVLLAARKRVEA